jgi:pseudaminic acid synthase
LIEQCEFIEIPWFSSVFDPLDVEFLETLNCPRYKISAYEMLDGDLIKAVVATGKPIILSVRSTGRATVLEATRCNDDVRTIGLSDHSGNTSLAVNAVRNGAPMVECHLCLPGIETPDSSFSLTPDEMAEYVRAIREASS